MPQARTLLSSQWHQGYRVPLLSVNTSSQAPIPHPVFAGGKPADSAAARRGAARAGVRHRHRVPVSPAAPASVGTSRAPMGISGESFTSLLGVKLPWQKNQDETASDAPADTSAAAEHSTDSEEQHPRGYTPKKGRPTPKRNERERERGVRREHFSAPETRAEARARRKKFKESMTKEEYKEYKARQKRQRREEQRRIQEGMDRGEERYLLERDKGEVRGFARDWVDARRFITNMMMPLALILLFIMLVSNAVPQISMAASVIAMIIMLAIFIEGIIMGRRVNRAARLKFPGSTEPGFGLGFYAFSRAGQPRRWRSPRPRVEIGAEV